MTVLETTALSGAHFGELAAGATPDLSGLAWRLVEAGPAAHEDEIGDLAVVACRVGIPEALLAVLTDESAPEVVRLRAFARIAPMVEATFAR